ncbi:ATP-dependent DNA helicase PIF1-like protein [Tanacetum coccineum]
MVNDIICSTFKEACFAYGLLNDDKEWTRAIQEASLWALGPQLRDLVVTILLFCDVSRPLKLWEENWEVLSDDILHKKHLLFKYPELQLTKEQIQNYCLLEIQDLLNTNGRALTKFSDMPQPNPSLLTSLNPEQRLIYEEVVDSIHNQKDQFHFVYGPGGTGKTFLYKTNISRLRSELKIVLDVASSGIASLLLPGGRTAHSSMRVNEYTSNGDIDTRKQTFNQWVLAVSDGKVPAKIKDEEDEPTWIEIPDLPYSVIRITNSADCRRDLSQLYSEAKRRCVPNRASNSYPQE